MSRILCIDTGSTTSEALLAAGHGVFAGTLGYTDKQPRLATPPHEVDLVICDLTRPACYDSNWWGPGRNDNFQCTVVPDPPIAWKRIADGREVPRYQIVHRSQMLTVPPHTFGAGDVHRAVSRAGVPLLFMLNPEWQAHVSYDSPDVSGLVWRFAPTTAERIEVLSHWRPPFPSLRGKSGLPDRSHLRLSKDLSSEWHHPQR